VVNIGTSVSGSLQVIVGPVAHDGSVKITCSGGLILYDSNGPVNSIIEMKCHEGRYQPSVDPIRLKELRCVNTTIVVPAPTTCFPPSELFLPIEAFEVNPNRYEIDPAPSQLPQSPGYSILLKCKQRSGNSGDLPEYLVYFFNLGKLVLDNPPSPPYEPTLNFTCNSAGIWETSLPYGKEFVKGVAGSGFTGTGQLTYGGVSCGDFGP